MLCNVGNDSVFSVVNLESMFGVLGCTSAMYNQLLSLRRRRFQALDLPLLPHSILLESLPWCGRRPWLVSFFFPPTVPLHYWDWIWIMDSFFTRSSELRSCAVRISLVATSNGWDRETALEPRPSLASSVSTHFYLM